MSILVLAEIDEKGLSDVTRRTMAAALMIGANADLVLTGPNAKAVSSVAAGLGGVGKVLCAETPSGPAAVEDVADLLFDLAQNYEVLIGPATAFGKSVMPRVAALLDVMQVSEIIEVLAPDTFKRTIYAGNAIQTVRSVDKKTVITVRPSSFAAVGDSGAAEIEFIDPVSRSRTSRQVHRHALKSERPSLLSAPIVVSGGRALGSEENFNTIVVGLADALHAGVGASRAAVDAGFAPNDWQVGQTGKIVAPDLYIAIGISGAIQHVAGMKEARVIVAINSDPEAPIFNYADYSLVGDLFSIVPELTAAVGGTDTPGAGSIRRS